MTTMLNKAAEAVDPEIWAIDGPTPTRGDVTDFHARRQRSISIALAVLHAIREPSDTVLEHGQNLANDAYLEPDELPADAYFLWQEMIDTIIAEQEA